MDKIFLSTPITNSLNKETGLMHTDIATKISRIQECLISQRYEVFLAIDRENWGRTIMSPSECTPLDFYGVSNSSHMVVIISKYISDGVLIEIGWASALNIPITIFCEKESNLSPLVLGLPTIGEHQIFYVDFEDTEMIEIMLLERVKKCK
ncbi:hypothetical protein [Candidatus Enterococcus ikei]|uniref:Nucleoside 2-deoxyribosyltransferase n=1 Tax=Candidatus Enterococcus ikei TaxID=2815326 RepID=A0ABS3GUS3_9ENTE|nr:hypothetical protein [Enterococcus sp. DIV0869a]MBO0439017.1 hypothetical protein [Enterococcus sp. DIV0869a]